MIKSSPMHRLGSPSEVAEVVVWLCSDACTFATGAVFDVSVAAPPTKAVPMSKVSQEERRVRVFVSA